MTPYAPPQNAEALRAMYPERDGRAMSDNTKQARWIFLIFGNLCALLADNDRAFVAADNLWYPLEKQPKVRQAPDVYVVFGRPKGDRGSYMQWLEEDVPLTVVFEILSPGNTRKEMVKKFDFYELHGVEEYYVYDPDRNTLEIYTRDEGTLHRHRDIAKFVSPRLGIRFEMTHPEMMVYRRDDIPFIPFEELRREADDNAKRADDNARRADDNAKRADDNAKRADDNARRADDAIRRADDNARRADEAIRRAVRVTELGQKTRRGEATPEEAAEFERLLGE